MTTRRTGHINLFSLYEFAATYPELVKGSKMKPFTKIVNDLVRPIPTKESGWYLWGRFNDVGWWETNYLGKAEIGKTGSLCARITEEIKDELVWCWATVHGYERTIKQAGSASAEVIRSLRKRNSHFIVWITALEREDVKDTEKFLISAFRPASNIQRKTLHNPPLFVADIIDDLEEEFNSMTV
jgi:hypothetical protein